eukprot:scaffold23370_cov139-Skeletonema_marinoi.AAC.15
MFSRQTVLAVLAASAALMSVDAFAPAARPIALNEGIGLMDREEQNRGVGSSQDVCIARFDGSTFVR